MSVKITKERLGKSCMIAASMANEASKQASLYRTITSDVLFAGSRELLIKHASESYRLRITNQGKLILTK
jgi:hemin uptake protein HemP